MVCAEAASLRRRVQATAPGRFYALLRFSFSPLLHAVLRFPPDRLSRRSLLSLLLVAGCGRKRANRYPGWMFVSSAAERGIAVADLSNFRRMQTIALNASPCALIRTGTGVGAVCADPALAVRIDPAQMSVVSRLRLPARPLSAIPSPTDVRSPFSLLSRTASSSWMRI